MDDGCKRQKQGLLSHCLVLNKKNIFLKINQNNDLT